jgi:hypothetical protein
VSCWYQEGKEGKEKLKSGSGPPMERARGNSKRMASRQQSIRKKS